MKDYGFRQDVRRRRGKWRPDVLFTFVEVMEKLAEEKIPSDYFAQLREDLAFFDPDTDAVAHDVFTIFDRPGLPAGLTANFNANTHLLRYDAGIGCSAVELVWNATPGETTLQIVGNVADAVREVAMAFSARPAQV